MAKSDAELRAHLTAIADHVEALVRSLSAVGVTRVDIERSRIAVEMERIGAAKKVRNG